MVFRYRVNGYKLWRKFVKDLVGEECEILNFLNFVIDGDEIDSDLFVFKLLFIVVFVVVFCVFVLCYFNLCKGDFVFDDFEVIEGNKDLNFDILFGKLFFYDFWGINISLNISYKSYWFFIILMFWFNYWLVGGFKFWGFYFFNVIFYVVVLVLCLWFFFIFVSGRNKIIFYYDNVIIRIWFFVFKVSFVCVFLFVVYLIYIESVSINNFFVFLMVNFIFLILDLEKFGNFVSWCFIYMLFFLVLSILLVGLLNLFI